MGGRASFQADPEIEAALGGSDVTEGDDPDIRAALDAPERKSHVIEMPEVKIEGELPPLARLGQILSRGVKNSQPALDKFRDSIGNPVDTAEDYASRFVGGMTANLDQRLPFGIGDAIKADRELATERSPKGGAIAELAGILASPGAEVVGGGTAARAAVNAAVNSGGYAAAHSVGDAKPEDDIAQQAWDALGAGAKGMVVGGAGGYMLGKAADILGSGATTARRFAIGGNSKDYKDIINEQGTRKGIDYVANKLGDIPEEQGLTNILVPQSKAGYAKRAATRAKKVLGPEIGESLDRAAGEIPKPRFEKTGARAPAKPPPLPETPAKDVEVFEGDQNAPQIFMNHYAKDMAVPVQPKAAEESTDFESAPPEVRGLLERAYGSKSMPEALPEPSGYIAQPPPLPKRSYKFVPGAVDRDAAMRALARRGQQIAKAQRPGARQIDQAIDQMDAAPFDTPKDVAELKRAYESEAYAIGAIGGSRESRYAQAQKTAADVTRDHLRDVMSQASPETNAQFTRANADYGATKLVEKLAKRGTVSDFAVPLAGAGLGGFTGYESGHDLKSTAEGAVAGALAGRYGADATANVLRIGERGARAASESPAIAKLGGLLADKYGLGSKASAQDGPALPGAIQDALRSNQLGPYSDAFARASMSQEPNALTSLYQRLSSEPDFARYKMAIDQLADGS